RSSGGGMPSRAWSRAARKTSFAMWSDGSGRSCRCGVAIRGSIGRTAPPPPRRNWRIIGPRSSRHAPSSCSRCGTGAPKRRTPRALGASAAVPTSVARSGAICCCSESIPGGRRGAWRSRRGGRPWRSGSTSAASWTALRPRWSSSWRRDCPGSGAIHSLTGGDGRDRVKPGAWSGLNELVYVTGGAKSALWTDAAREHLAAAPELSVATARLDSARRERLPGIGVRLVIARKLDGFAAITSVVTLYDELPWVDIENRCTTTATLDKEALYVAFPFA